MRNDMNNNINNDLTKLEQLCETYGLDTKDGFSDTYVDEVKLFKVSSNDDLMPLLYNKGFSFIGQGKKIGYINDVRFEHGYTDYLVISSPQPVECETYILGDEPLIGIYINLDMNRLQRVVRKYSKFVSENKKSKEITFSITCNIRTEVIQEIYIRLLNILTDEAESNMMSDGLLDELYYRILQSSNGAMLALLCEENSNVSKISRTVEYIIENIDQKISLDEMARLADMSINNFHKLFKQALNDTPVQYIKKIRLYKARQLIIYNNMKAVDAAQEVGYDSTSQFSREFKRYFGVSPSKIKDMEANESQVS